MNWNKLQYLGIQLSYFATAGCGSVALFLLLLAGMQAFGVHL